jgi:hypothetical protein
VRLANAAPRVARRAAVHQPAAADDHDLVEQEQEDGAAERGLAVPAEPPADTGGAAQVGEEVGRRQQEQTREQVGQEEDGDRHGQRRQLAPAVQRD